MTHAITQSTLSVLHAVAFGLGAALLVVMLVFILGVCLCSITRPRSNGYAQRLRMPKRRIPRRTLIVTPEIKDPRIVGDVSQAQWPKASRFASRPNLRAVEMDGEG